MVNGLPEYDHSLPDGTTVHIRAIRPDDAGRVIAMWQRLSADTIHSRFFGLVRIDESNVAEYVELDPERQVALVAVLGRGDGERMVGMARYDRLPEDARTAEFSALVEDAYQGRGIGTALLRYLAEAARAAGVQTLTGDVLRDNVRMLRLLADLGLHYERRNDFDVVHATFEVQPTEEYLAAVARDEKRAAEAALTRFLRPERVAVVGAGRDRRSIGGLVFANILSGGFSGTVYPVNHRATTVQSVAAYPTLSDCPEVPDLAVVCVPAPAVAAVVDEAGKLGVRAVCVVSAGFAECGPAGAALQDELMELARGHGLRVVGPNCMGILNGACAVRLNATFSAVFPDPGRLGFLSQSGALGLSALEHLHGLGIGVGTFVSVGNKADISGNDLLLYWEDDPDTDVILLYLESFGNPRRFARIARRVSRRKPILAVKAGRTSAGRRAASSHTAAISAGDVAVDALFRQTGVIRTDTLEELFAAASLLADQPAPRGRRVGIITNGGGPGILAADACEAHGLEVPALSDAVRERLEQILPPEAGIANPVDMIASSTAEQYGEVVRILGESKDTDALIVIFIPPIVTRAEDVADALVEASAALPPDKPLLSVFMSARGIPPALARAHIPSFAFPEEAALALGRVAEWAEWRDRPQGAVVRPDDVKPGLARAAVAAALSAAAGTGAVAGAAEAQAQGRRRSAAEGVWLSAAESEQVLGAYGVPLARARRVSTPAEAATAQQELGGEVVVKPAAAIHKSDVGALRLGIDSPEAAARAVEEIRSTLAEAGLGEHGGELLVQEMITEGVEMAAGVSHDPSFGPLVMVGFGGTLVELLRDVAVRITPLTDVDVDDMLRSLKAYRLLSGYRGSPPVDVQALTELLYRLNALVEDVPEVAELDLNPVFVRRRGVVAVDVRMRVAQAEGERSPTQD